MHKSQVYSSIIFTKETQNKYHLDQAMEHHHSPEAPHTMSHLLPLLKGSPAPVLKLVLPVLELSFFFF